MMRQSFSGLGGAWSSAGRVIVKSQGKLYRKAIDRLPEIHARLRNVNIEHKDAVDCIEFYASPQSLIYCDPPYVSDTRVSNIGGEYRHEYTDEQHKKLVETLLSVPGHKVLSGYESPIYEPLLAAGWSLEKKEFPCNVSQYNRESRTECLYSSPGRTIKRDSLI